MYAKVPLTAQHRDQAAGLIMNYELTECKLDWSWPCFFSTHTQY